MMIDLHQAAQVSAQGVLNTMAEGIGIALFAAALLRAFGHRNSRTRFAVWFCALLAIVLLPLFSLLPSDAVMGSRATFTIASSWAVYLVGTWAAISGISLLRVGLGIAHVIALRRSCSLVDIAALDPLLQSTIREAQASRRVAILVSDRQQVPTAIGLLKPAVIIPRWALRELSTPDLNAILLHELAHLQRWDDWTNLAQKLFRAVLFFHPAVWWIESKLSVEREMACDDIVLAKTDAKSYAECLIVLAEKNYMRRGLAMAQAAVHHASQTAKRLAQILDVNRPSATLISKPAVAMVVVFAAGCFAAAPHAPRIVAFGEKAPAVRIAAVPSAPVVAARHSSLVPKIVPASFTAAGKPNVRPAKKAAVTRDRKPVPQQADVHLARAKDPTADGVVIPQATFVVMQTRQQYNAAGPGGRMWTLTVWRVTIIQRDRPEMVDPSFRSKST